MPMTVTAKVVPGGVCQNRSFVERRAVLAASDVRLRGAARRGMCRTRR